ncbi:MAG TPA: methyl-accepting chemotaxis protein [Gemmatimonadaceae bacterium]|nr:methyl-accepting chemotaxis protein [Gemmatimonadaceae bacterium]
MTDTITQLIGSRTIGGRLLRAFLVIAVLLTGAGVLAYQSLHSSAETATDALEVIRRDARLSAELSAAVAEEIQAASLYLRDGDTSALETFQRLNLQTHRITRSMNRQTTRETDHIALVAMVDRTLSEVEVTYSRAHRYMEMGDIASARRSEAAVTTGVKQLLGGIDRLGSLTERQVTLVAADMRREAETRALAVLLVFGGVLILGTLLVGTTLRSINKPLHQLVEHADALSRGAFETRTSGRMPGEFEKIAAALNEAGTSLGVLATATAATAAELATSSSELSQVSDRIAHKATEVSDVMENVTRNAENQVGMLKKIDAELVANGQRAVEVRQEAGSVAMLAESIEREAIEKRQTITQAMAVMLDIRTSVQTASRTAESLHGVTEGIATFVTSVGRIAEQTNMLALNAAIEAARAGDAGRGFVVVADEVRKLAEAAQRAADDVARLTSAITGRVNETVSSMQRSAGLVGDIETVGRDVGTALESITASAERTVAAAANLSEIAAQNSAQMASVQQSLSIVAGDAVGHAVSAQQANASAQEQSAACQQMSAASQVLHGRSNRLRALVETRGAVGNMPNSTAEFMVSRKIEAVPATADDAPPARVMSITPLNNRVLNRAPRQGRTPPFNKRQA